MPARVSASSNRRASSDAHLRAELADRDGCTMWPSSIATARDPSQDDGRYRRRS